MEHPFMMNNRSEAVRWLDIAEKLLTNRDLVGSKSFASRARESDPSLGPATEQILAIVDTLIAGDKRMNEQQQHHDYYSILQIPPSQAHNADLIAAHYRRLSALLSPHSNPFPFSDLALRLLKDAFSVLSNPLRKSLYDNERGLSLNHPQQQHKDNVPNVATSKPSFWTACPYCYLMYEYPLDYADCTLRCQNCKRAFQAVTIATPPPVIDGKEAYFCCWGFMPLGLSLEVFQRQRGHTSTWSPFSPMFTLPRGGGGGGMSSAGQSHVNNPGGMGNAGGSTSEAGRKQSAPRIYVDEDDDVFVEISESDEDWNHRRKRANSGKRKTGTPSKTAKNQRVAEVKSVEGNNDVNVQDDVLTSEDSVEMSHVGEALPRKRRRIPVRVAKHFGDLDLNVEFSNEVEEPAVLMSQEKESGGEEEETVEVIGFFEGLDEFLSGFPILNAVDGHSLEAA